MGDEQYTFQLPRLQLCVFSLVVQAGEGQAENHHRRTTLRFIRMIENRLKHPVLLGADLTQQQLDVRFGAQARQPRLI
ncbi:hypothetical protein D3C84_995030 [compost metagenome]